MNNNTKTENTKPYGHALSAITGIDQNIILKIQSQILADLAGPKPSLLIHHVPWCFQPGGLLLVGDEIRTRSLLDHLLEPIHKIQNTHRHIASNLHEVYEKQNIASKITALCGVGMAHIDRLIEDGYKIDKGVHQLGDISRRRENTTHPLLLLENTNLDEIKTASQHSKAQSPLYIDYGCQLLHASEKTALPVLKSIRGSVQHSDSKTKYPTHPTYSRLGYIGIISEESLLEVLSDNNGMAEEILRSIQLIRLPGDQNEQEEVDYALVDDLYDELHSWKSAVYKAIDLRGQETPWSPQCIYSPKTYLFKNRRVNLNVHSGMTSHVDGKLLFDNLSTLLLGSTLLCESGASYHECPASVSCRANTSLFKNHMATERWLESERNRSVLDRDKARIIRALERRGSCTWQKLCRSFDVQRRDAHEAAINALISEGRLELDDEGMFKLLTTKAA
ncbi:hypothetical protein [Coraliomargarita parva]|uniref:hypothetical protein n=1 Tax=Coraliomargarita parva TaxID=3014050 RepID=UPI0022B47840|nr:hypothetical protein [Coraliomargarita parva]